MGAFAAPIVPGKLDTWRDWTAELTGSRKAGFEDMNTRYNLTDHRAWLQPTPDGQHMAVVLIEGPGADDFMPTLATSDDDFDAWFRAGISEVHGIDFSGPLPPPTQRFL
jgi:hypothetical protein